MGRGSSETVTSRHVSSLARAGGWALLAPVAFAVGAFVFQCVYWLRFGSWFDWTDPDGPAFPGSNWSGGPWKGVGALLDLILAAPVQLFASITGLTLVALYVWVRSLTRR